MTPRRVMVVAYGFPPVAGAAVERTIKFTTYLPEFGWERVVIAPSHSAYHMIDPASLNRIGAGTEVHRAPTSEPAHARRLARAIVAWANRRSSGSSGAGHPEMEAHSAGARRRLRTAANAWWGRLVSTLFFPDKHLLWVPSAVIAGLQAHRRRSADLIYSSSSPISAHLGRRTAHRHAVGGRLS